MSLPVYFGAVPAVQGLSATSTTFCAWLCTFTVNTRPDPDSASICSPRVNNAGTLILTMTRYLR